MFQNQTTKRTVQQDWSEALTKKHSYKFWFHQALKGYKKKDVFEDDRWQKIIDFLSGLELLGR